MSTLLYVINLTKKYDDSTFAQHTQHGVISCTLFAQCAPNPASTDPQTGVECQKCMHNKYASARLPAEMRNHMLDHFRPHEAIVEPDYSHLPPEALKKAQELAEAHWNPVGRSPGMNYVEAMIHGYVHGFEDGKTPSTTGVAQSGHHQSWRC